jgi:hypothetical protein
LRQENFLGCAGDRKLYHNFRHMHFVGDASGAGTQISLSREQRVCLEWAARVLAWVQSQISSQTRKFGFRVAFNRPVRLSFILRTSPSFPNGYWQRRCWLSSTQLN